MALRSSPLREGGCGPGVGGGGGGDGGGGGGLSPDGVDRNTISLSLWRKPFLRATHLNFDGATINIVTSRVVYRESLKATEVESVA